jgi:hypothetical protein
MMTNCVKFWKHHRTTILETCSSKRRFSSSSALAVLSNQQVPFCRVRLTLLHLRVFKSQKDTVCLGYVTVSICACASQQDSIELQNEGGRMGEVCLLCMLPFGVPLTFLICIIILRGIMPRMPRGVMSYYMRFSVLRHSSGADLRC